MEWEKLGLLYQPEPLHPKLISHAANPLAISLGGDRFAVLFSGRDERNRSSVGRVDIDLATRQVVAVHERPVFVHGGAGSFYEAGVSIGNCYEAGGKRYVLFMGWQAPAGGHWRGEIGRLELGQDLSLRLDGEGPFLGLSAVDPVSLSYPWVSQSGQGYDMWYGSTLSWDAGNAEMIHVLKHAASDNGHAWQRSDGAAIPWSIGTAQAFSRPTMLKIDNALHMWFSCRSGSGQTYRIGHAVSDDGLTWRHERAGALDVSVEGWDAEMVEYPFVFEHKGEIYMLYNGNGYGRTGIGLAVMAR